jgi:hypothetical protein
VLSMAHDSPGPLRARQRPQFASLTDRATDRRRDRD